MTEIKTAQAWGAIGYKGELRGIAHYSESEVLEAIEGSARRIPYKTVSPVLITYGLTEAEIHEAAALRSACRELDIETVEQLKARLEPDPRVAVLEPIQALLDEWPKYRDSVLGRKDDPPCSVCGGELDTGWECNACGHDMQMEVCPDIKLWGQITRLIAAQRGEE